jgi:hypothetical protein
LPAEGRPDEGSNLLDSKELAACQSSEDGSGGRQQNLPPAPQPSLHPAPQHSPGWWCASRRPRIKVGGRNEPSCAVLLPPHSANRTCAPPTPCPGDDGAARVPIAQGCRHPQGGIAPRAIAVRWLRHSSMAGQHGGPAWRASMAGRHGGAQRRPAGRACSALPSEPGHATFALPNARAGIKVAKELPIEQGSRPCAG